ncbi:MAG: glutamine synthetase type III, partial [Ruminococcus sp.]|nr:glutamine synthetase type III [Ruminococcus sp.]
DDTWIKEATEVRGLLNYPTTADCMPHLLDKKNVDMLTEHKVFTLPEMHSRVDIMLENYCKTVIIEANTMVEMAKRQIIPSVEAYTLDLSETAIRKNKLIPEAACTYEKSVVSKLAGLTDQMFARAEVLEKAVAEVKAIDDIIKQSEEIRDNILVKMAELREVCDEAEEITAASYWPFPTYDDLLFGVR